MRTCLVCLLLVCSAYPQNQTLLNGQPMELARAEALWKAHQYKEAGQLFESLVKSHPKDLDIKVRYGRLLLERFNPGDAANLFQEVLAIKKDHAGALLGMALVAADGFEIKAAEFARSALAADPKLVEAQELLARRGRQSSGDFAQRSQRAGHPRHDRLDGR